jgi:hypothetical protein
MGGWTAMVRGKYKPFCSPILLFSHPYCLITSDLKQSPIPTRTSSSSISQALFKHLFGSELISCFRSAQQNTANSAGTAKRLSQNPSSSTPASTAQFPHVTAPDQFHTACSSRLQAKAKESICTSMEVDGCCRVKPSKSPIKYIEETTLLTQPKVKTPT